MSTTSRRIRYLCLLGIAGWLLMTDDLTFAQITYQKPPKEVLAVLDAPPTPAISLSPSRKHVLLLQGQSYPPIADLAQPMLKLAGFRLNPKTNGPHAPPRLIGITLLDMAEGTSKPLKLPEDPYVSALRWSPDGKQIAFSQVTRDRIELWLGDVATGTVRQVPGVALNAAHGDPFQWLPGSKSLVCQIIPPGRGPPPEKPAAPKGPKVMESVGKTAPARTYPDLLQDEHDEELFEYYCTSQLVMIHAATGKVTPVGKLGVIDSVDPSPAGTHLLVARLHKPYSYVLPAYYFPREVEVWDHQGKVVHKLASLPLADQVPIEGVPTGPRQYHWQPDALATLVWVEALDGGDPKKKVPYRDEIFRWAAPFQGKPQAWFKTPQRFFGIGWTDNGLAFVRDYDRDKKWQHTVLLDSHNADAPPRPVWDMSINERYADPGLLATKTLPSGQRVIHRDQDKVFLLGKGATPKGDFPFLDTLDLKTLKTTRLFQCAGKHFEVPLGLLKQDGSEFLTSFESATEPPNYFIHRTDGTKKALTHFTDPTPELRQIKKELVTYQRDDGVALSFTLYLPPGYKAGEHRPAVVWAYPREFADAATAGQVSGSPHRFTSISGPSHLFFLLQGYVVLDGATLPVVGDPETANNTYIKQIVAGAKAAIDKGTQLGVIDPDRVGVGGHSYGAFMTANLLAHCDLFRAGIARSGAYNRTLTPFGFQNERRTLWEAPEAYIKMSPFLHADKIKAPLLLIHGEADDNTGTFYVQSERMYQAMKGNGGTVRFVSLPLEAHGYRARESVEHTLHEMLTWFNTHVKNAPPRAKE